MPAQIDQVNLYSRDAPPKTGYVRVQDATEATLAVDVDITNEQGDLLARFQNMRFAEIEGAPGVGGSVESLVHQLSWPPAALAEEPLSLGHVSIVSEDEDAVERYEKSLLHQTTSISRYSSVQGLAAVPIANTSARTIIYIPEPIESFNNVPEAAEKYCAELLDIIKYATGLSAPIKVFVITGSVFKGEHSTALAHAPLLGLGRIIASAQSDIWGALIDSEDSTVPLQAIKYIQGADVVRVSDGVARKARLRPLPREKPLSLDGHKNLFPRPEGTYVITGGLGALGLEIANFLVEKNARRIVLISRRALPPRNEWDRSSGALAEVVQAIRHLESLGATVHVVPVDLGVEGSEEKLQAALDRLALPQVLGVVHAAGVLEDQLILYSDRESFHRVLAPKMTGSLALHRLFPTHSLDFFVLFSSCGQLFGFPGQGSYASGNAFLDTLATHRRNQGDNCVAIQWTSWRGLGMAASTDFINAELESKGITDVTRDEAFRAWTHIAKHDIDHAVVLRSLTFDHDEPLPVPILADIAVRRPAVATESSSTDGNSGTAAGGQIPTSGPALADYLNTKIRECVVKVLQLASIDEVDPRAALLDLGMDSVMTVGLRRLLQQALGVKVPPMLMWSHLMVLHLRGWFVEKLEKGK